MRRPRGAGACVGVRHARLDLAVQGNVLQRAFVGAPRGVVWILLRRDRPIEADLVDERDDQTAIEEHLQRPGGFSSSGR